MVLLQHIEADFRRDEKMHHGTVRLRLREEGGMPHYQAVLVDTPLHGTFGGWASSIDDAIDYLNLAMQAEGAEEIVVMR